MCVRYLHSLTTWALTHHQMQKKIYRENTLKHNIHNIRTFIHVSESGNVTMNLKRLHVSLFDTLTAWIIAPLNLPFLLFLICPSYVPPCCVRSLGARKEPWQGNSLEQTGRRSCNNNRRQRISAISVGECGWTGEGAGRRECWEQRQTSSIPELCAHIFLSLSSRVSSADATARRKGLLLFILSLPFLASPWPLAEGVCVCRR